jgi:hypothetical protein
VVTLAASLLFGWRGESWAGVAFGVVVAVAMAALVARWSRRRGWGAAHWLALAGAALVHQAVTGFVLTQRYGRQGPIHVIGNVVFALGAVALLLAGVRTARRSAGGAVPDLGRGLHLAYDPAVRGRDVAHSPAPSRRRGRER